MDNLAQLQHWYRAQCDEDWEHSYGVHIGTLDNPGWTLDIDLTGTSLEQKLFPSVHYGLFEEAETSGDEWLMCKVEDGKFVGRGGPFKLNEMIGIFLRWAGYAA